MPRFKDTDIFHLGLQVREETVEGFKQVLEQANKTLTGAQHLLLATHTQDAELTHWLVSQGMKRKLKGDLASEAHGAALTGDAQHVQLATKRGVTWFEHKKAGWPIELAAKRGHAQIIETILAAEPLNDFACERALGTAIEAGHVQVAMQLVQAGVGDSKHLNRAMMLGQQELADALVTKGIRTTSRTSYLLTPLDWAKIAEQSGVSLADEPVSWISFLRSLRDRIAKEQKTVDWARVDAVVAGQRGNAEDLGSFLSLMEGDPDEELAPLTNWFLDCVDCGPSETVTQKGRLDPVSDEWLPFSALDAALEHSPLWLCRLLDSRGYRPLHAHSGASWAKDKGKRELFVSSGASEAGATAADLIAQDIVEIADADLLDQALTTSGAFGLRPGLSRTDVSALGLPASRDFHNIQSDNSEDGQHLEYQFEEDTLGDVEYILHRRGGDWLDAAREAAVEHLRGLFGDDARRHTYQFITDAGRWKISQEVRNIPDTPITVGYLTVRLERATPAE